MTRLEVLGVRLPGEVRPGDDLAALIAAAEPALADGDVVVVTSKVVSKAEGRVVGSPTDPEGREAARQAAVDAEAVRAVAARGRTRIVETAHGFVLAAAGVDASNAALDALVLLPADPDASARRLRAGLAEALGVDVAVVVSDTFGRPWRRGLVDVAIGAAGIAPLRDYRGSTDPYGNPLVMTEMADVDALAAAAELVKGKLAGVPVAVIRGFQHERSDAGVRALVRPPGEDLFRLGTAEATAAGRRALAEELVAGAAPKASIGLLGGPPDRDLDHPVERVLRTLLGPAADLGVFHAPEERRVRVMCRRSEEMVAAGLLAARIIAALAAAGVPAAVERVTWVRPTGHQAYQTVVEIALGDQGVTG
ncbi:MAG: coenzyme F420-0:L-glutamate ligase [Frankiaceae bacterium]